MDDAESARRIAARGLAPYERLAAMDRADPEFDAWCSQVRDDFMHRLANRREDQPPSLWRVAHRHTYGPRPVGPLWLVNPLIVLGVPLLLAVLMFPPLFVAAIIGILTFRLLYGFDRRARRTAALRCPTCGYDLRALPDALPSLDAGFMIGPRRCPECGEPWPRVPDPASR